MKTIRGFTLLELLGALAIGSMMILSLSTMIDTSLTDTKGQQTAQYQSQVASAAAKYITANYAILVAMASPTTPVPVLIDALKATGYLSTGFSTQNAYGQTPCILVLQPAPNKLDVLIVTEGGSDIADKDIGYIAANAGQGGGYITETGPPEAKGAFESWLLDTATLAIYISQKCSATAAGSGHLANALFYSGPGQLATDFLYRDAVSGRPELNRMKTPLHIVNAATPAVEDTSDTDCISTNIATFGGISTNLLGEVLSCQAGIWRRQGTKFWKDPVATYLSLPALGNTVGDVRMVTGLNRAFTWNGSWKPLAVDENGRLTADEIQIDGIVVKGTVCPSNGLLGRDINGLTLSCQSGIWSGFSTIELGASILERMIILRSNYGAVEPAGAVLFPGSITYDAPVDTYYARRTTNVAPLRDGLIVANASSIMYRGITTDTTQSGQFFIIIEIFNKDTNVVVGQSASQSFRFTNDRVGLSTSLSKTVAKNTNGYDIVITTGWSTLNGDGTNGYGIYDRSNFMSAASVIVESTPLETDWSWDIFY
jgi:type II secretory pathway pseudopilin PulG